MGDIFGTEFNKRKEKIEFLKNKNIALWDIIKSCERKNSLDSNLKNIEVNDIKLLLKKYPNIEVLFFTGKKAFEVYNKNFKLNIESIYLPSPSPAYAKMKYIEKLTIWKENLSKFLDLH
jgi:hypoxanthine-DNA glycosylase